MMQLDEKIACKGRGNHTEVVQAQKQAWNTDQNFILLQLKLSNMFDFRSFTLRYTSISRSSSGSSNHSGLNMICGIEKVE